MALSPYEEANPVTGWLVSSYCDLNPNDDFYCKLHVWVDDPIHSGDKCWATRGDWCAACCGNPTTSDLCWSDISGQETCVKVPPTFITYCSHPLYGQHINYANCTNAVDPDNGGQPPDIPWYVNYSGTFVTGGIALGIAYYFLSGNSSKKGRGNKRARLL